MEIYQITITVAIALVILELLTGTFVLLGFGVGAFFVGAIQFFFAGLNFNRDILCFSIISLLSIYLLRTIFKSKADQKFLAEDDINRY